MIGLLPSRFVESSYCRLNAYLMAQSRKCITVKSMENMQVDEGAIWGVSPSLHPPYRLLFVLVALGFSVVLLLPFADLASIRLLLVQVGEDELEYLAVPAGWTALNTLLDVLWKF